MAMLRPDQLSAMGFKSVGEHVLVSDKASIYGASRISLGNHVRIDDFCILSAGEGGIEIGNHVHIACFASLIGKELIRMEDFSALSSRVAVYSSSDDFSGEWMTNPTVSPELTHVDHRPVVMRRHCIVGANSVILPGVTLGEGCAIGALSLVSKDCKEFAVYLGVPARRLKERSRRMVELGDALEGSK